MRSRPIVGVWCGQVYCAAAKFTAPPRAARWLLTPLSFPACRRQCRLRRPRHRDEGQSSCDNAQVVKISSTDHIIYKGPPGSVPPGGVPPGRVPPGGVFPGRVPPGRVPPGNVPPGRVPPGRVPPGTVPPGSVPPGSIPPRGVLSRSVSGFISSEAGGRFGFGGWPSAATVRLQGMQARKTRPAERTIERSDRCDIATLLKQIICHQVHQSQGRCRCCARPLGAGKCQRQSIRCEGLSCLSRQSRSSRLSNQIN